MSLSTSSLHRAWYNAVAGALGLKPKLFLIASAAIPLGSTSRELWEYYDSVPATIEGNYYQINLFNRVSQCYGAVVNLIIPQAGTSWREAIGDFYADWVAFLDSASEIPRQGMLAMFTGWAERTIPDPAQASRAIAAYRRIVHGTVPVAQDRFLEAAGVYAYSRSISDARSLVTSAPEVEFSFNGSPTGVRQLPTAAESFAEQLAARGMSRSLRDAAASAAAKLTASRVHGKAVFDHYASVGAGPLQSRQVVGNKAYPGWFSSAALDLAYGTHGAPIWPHSIKPNWQQTFGNRGNLRRLVTSLILVDGMDVELVAHTQLSDADCEALTRAAAVGVTPLITLASASELRAAGFDAASVRSRETTPAIHLIATTAEETTRIHIHSPVGAALLFGVIATPTGDLVTDSL